MCLIQLFNVGSVASAVETQTGVYLGDSPEVVGASYLGSVAGPIVEGRSTVRSQGVFLVPNAVMDGAYLLGLAADASTELEEAHEGDNTAFTTFRVSADEACVWDVLEPNGSPFEEGGAAPLPPNSPQVSTRAGRLCWR